jgi:hypothetical protein
MQKENKLTRNFIIGTFVTLYVMVSLISTIHVIDFFELSNPRWLAITLAISFEVGAAASLASIIALKKMNKGIVWILFFILTAMQAMGNAFFAYTHLNNYQEWIELFGLIDSELIEQKRILSIVSGAILPLVALGFIKSLVDYIRPDEGVTEGVTEGVNPQITDAVTQVTNEVITDVELESETNESNVLDETNIEIGFEDEGDDNELFELIDKVKILNPENYLEDITEDDYSEEEHLLNLQNELIEEEGEAPIENIVEEKKEESEIINNEDKENYSVYDKTEEMVKNNSVENIMVFTKNGDK